MTKARRPETVSQVFQLAYETHWRRKTAKSGWAKEVLAIYRRNIEKPFGRRLIANLSVKDIRNWHHKMKKKPYEGNRALAVLSKCYLIAQQEEILEVGHNPCMLVPRHREKKRSRYASIKEMQNLFKALEDKMDSHPEHVAYVYCILYSGARPKSILNMRWKDIEITHYEGERFGVFAFDGKGTEYTGEKETVVFPDKVLTLLEDIEKRKPRFEQKRNTPILYIKHYHKFWDRIKREAGLEDLWLRDLRRTFATVGMGTNLSPGVISELLNHKSAQTMKIYAKLDPRPRLAAVSRIGKELDSITSQVSPDEGDTPAGPPVSIGFPSREVCEEDDSVGDVALPKGVGNTSKVCSGDSLLSYDPVGSDLEESLEEGDCDPPAIDMKVEEGES